MPLPREYDRPSKIVQQLGFLSKPELDQIRRAQTVSYRRNILITVPGFMGWLKFIDTAYGGSPDWYWTVNRYRHYVQGYVMWITQLLNGISAFDTGRAVLKKFDGISHSVTISPEPWNHTLEGRTSPANPRDLPDTVADGEWVSDDDDRVGTGKGADVVISLSPSAFAYFDMPGFTPDETLLHEVVHAAFMVHGRNTSDHVNRRFKDEGEWNAILITNIYRSERGKHDLLGAHDAPLVFITDTDNFLDNPKLRPSPRFLLDRFKRFAPILFDDIASIPVTKAKFNPVRQYRYELNQRP